ncbi:hypothetical protein Q5752_000469 [Cryptotrichosporon argae]
MTQVLPALYDPRASIAPELAGSLAASTAEVLVALSELPSSLELHGSPPSLAPLPSLVLPPAFSRPAARPSAPSAVPSAPRIPAPHPLSGAQTVDDCLAAANASSSSVRLRKRGDHALLCRYKTRLAETGRVRVDWAWVLLSAIDGGVRRVTAFVGVGEAKEPPVHATPSNAASTRLSGHLDSLGLALSDLLYRLPHIFALCDTGTPCYICKQVRHSADANAAAVGVSRFGVVRHGHKAGADGADGEVDETGEETWVAWHAACA